MALWTLFELASGKATTAWPGSGETRGRWACSACLDTIPPPAARDAECAAVCPTHAIEARDGGLAVDYGRCVVCQLVTEACPTDAMTPSGDWAFGVTNRQDLLWSEASPRPVGKRPNARPSAAACTFGMSTPDRATVASRNCRLSTTPSTICTGLGSSSPRLPRFADLLLVTGPVTHAMREPLKAAYEAMAEPRWVMAVGTCAVSGGISGGNYASRPSPTTR